MAVVVAYSLFQVLSDFFARYGYWVVFFGVMLENAGLPVPGETVLVFAGFLAYQGNVHLGRAILTAIAGATVGDSAGYCLGRFGAAALYERSVSRLGVLRRRFERARGLFGKHGHWAVFVGRFITGLRVFAGPLAGMSRMPYPRFLFFNFTGAIAWAITFGCLGFAFGSSWEKLTALVARLQWAVVAAAALAAALAVAILLWKSRRAE